MRLAVVTSDMGVSYGEDRDIPTPDETPASLQAYLNRGDDGKFQANDMVAIDLGDGAIACSEAATQCPADWTCVGIGDDGVGACSPEWPGTVSCPAIGAGYVALSDVDDDTDAKLNVEAACLAQQGTSGCGFEQQLQAAAVARDRDDQDDFLENGHLLAVLVISDEEDCSMRDAPGLFATPDCQDSTRLNIACNASEEDESYLFDARHFRDAFVDAKGDEGSVVFAAIAGVPQEDQEPVAAAACEGRGDALGACLDQEAMQMVPFVDSSSGTDLWKFMPACTRYVGDALVTSAVPGRRYVEIAAEEFGDRGFVSSICNADWTPAFDDLAALIAERIAASQGK